MKYDFLDHKIRCSELGHLLTHLPTIREFTKEDEERLKVIRHIKIHGVHPETKRKNKYELLVKEHTELVRLKRGIVVDELPTGAITYLKKVFNRFYFDRYRNVDTKQLRKGTQQEQQGIDLISYIHGEEYEKNEVRYSNDYLQGEMDIVKRIVIDNKCSYDLESFDNVESLILDYMAQVCGYMILARDNNIPLESYTKGKVCYTLVNNSLDEILVEKDRLRWKYGITDDDNAPDEYWDEIMQIEKNMIFDLEVFKEENPYYPLTNPILDFHIPKEFRIKEFEVELTPEFEQHIERRCKMALKWLQDRAKMFNDKYEQLNK